jgi:hypothetical protein
VNVTHQVRVRSVSRGAALSIRSKAEIATLTGLAGGVAMAVPVVLYDWASSLHSALELPMAATAWMFGLDNFTQNGYQWSSIVVGTLLLAAYAIAGGAVFSGFSDRFLRLTTLPETVGVGLAWGFVSWLFFWYTLLPIAHAGVPFMASITPVTLWGVVVPIAGPTVAPVWVFILGFALLGIATSLTYRLLRRA